MERYRAVAVMPEGRTRSVIRVIEEGPWGDGCANAVGVEPPLAT